MTRPIEQATALMLGFAERTGVTGAAPAQYGGECEEPWR